MRLNDNPILPQNPDTDYAKALNRALLDLLRSSNQKVNGLADGRFSARDRVAVSVPTAGSFATGDFVANSAPAELGTAGSKYVLNGWLNVAGGSPGTFVQQRSLTGN